MVRAYVFVMQPSMVRTSPGLVTVSILTLLLLSTRPVRQFTKKLCHTYVFEIMHVTFALFESGKG